MEIQEDASPVPYDIIEDILSRLPVKSLLRFKSVSKSWNTMISDPRFVRIHQQRSMKSNNLILRETFLGRFSLIGVEVQNFKIESVVREPDGGWLGDSFMCFGNGLVLLTRDNFHYKKYILWNPCTRQETILRFPYHYYFYNYMNMYGLCYDPRNDDFKVVIAFQEFYAVFSCKNSSWTEKKDFFYPSIEIAEQNRDGGLCVDGAVYWAWYEEHEKTCKLLCFDPTDDDFKILHKPDYIKDNQLCFDLSCLKGCLCLSWDVMYETTIKIWIKEKGGPGNTSWKVLINIENLEMRIWRHKLLSFVEDKIVILEECARLCIYDIAEKSYKKMKESESSMGRWYYPCLDTMFFPVMENKRIDRKLTRSRLS